MTLKNSILRRFLWCALLPAMATAVIAAAAHLHVVEALILAFVLALLASWLSARALWERINRLKTFAENLVHSRPPALNPSPAFEGELGALARTLSRAAEQWQELLEQLRLESARREAILKAMVEGVLAVDRDLRVIFCNDSFARLVGARLPLLPRLPLLNLVRDPSLQGMLVQVLAAHQPMRQTLQLAAADSRVFEVQAAPLSEPDRPGAIAILHDITDLERLERVRKDFVANVSHELRTPLTAIRGYTETLLDGAVEDPKENRKFLGIILNHAIRLNRIASDLLVLSELESGRNQPEPQRISVRAIVEAALHAVEEAAEREDVRLIAGKVEDAEVTGSSVRLEQALVNLLDNAIKFNRPGGVVRVEAERQAENTVSITVSDNGIGIPSEDLSRIFERFYRVDKARARDAGSTGLGLSIVKHAIERMGGAVRVESQVGKGSTFTVTLPAESKAR